MWAKKETKKFALLLEIPVHFYKANRYLFFPIRLITKAQSHLRKQDIGYCKVYFYTSMFNEINLMLKIIILSLMIDIGSTSSNYNIYLKVMSER